MFPHGGRATNGLCLCGAYLYKEFYTWSFGCVKCGSDARPVDWWRVGTNQTGIYGPRSEKKYWANRGLTSVPRGPSPEA